MKLPISCDPAYQELQRESRWSRVLDSCPVCANCGEPIIADTRFYFPKRDEFWCPDCIDRMEEPNDIFENEPPKEDY